MYKMVLQNAFFTSLVQQKKRLFVRSNLLATGCSISFKEEKLSGSSLVKILSVIQKGEICWYTIPVLGQQVKKTAEVCQEFK